MWLVGVGEWRRARGRRYVRRVAVASWRSRPDARERAKLGGCIGAWLSRFGSTRSALSNWTRRSDSRNRAFAGGHGDRTPATEPRRAVPVNSHQRPGLDGQTRQPASAAELPVSARPPAQALTPAQPSPAHPSPRGRDPTSQLATAPRRCPSAARGRRSPASRLRANVRGAPGSDVPVPRDTGQAPRKRLNLPRGKPPGPADHRASAPPNRSS